MTQSYTYSIVEGTQMRVWVLKYGLYETTVRPVEQLKVGNKIITGQEILSITRRDDIFTRDPSLKNPLEHIPLKICARALFRKTIPAEDLWIVPRQCGVFTVGSAPQALDFRMFIENNDKVYYDRSACDKAVYVLTIEDADVLDVDGLKLLPLE